MPRKICYEKQMWLHPHQRNQMPENAATGFQTRSHQSLVAMQRGHGIIVATQGRPGLHCRCSLPCAEPEVYSVAFAASGSSRALTGSGHAHDGQTNQHSAPNPGRPSRKNRKRINPPLETRKGPGGPFCDAGALGAAQRWRKDSLENGRERRGPDKWSRRARPISGARLRRSRALHLRPINQVVSLGPYRREGPSRGRLPA